MKKAALFLAVAAIAACNREQSYSTPAPTASSGGNASATGTWVASPGDLSPEQVRTVQRALGDRGFAVELSGKYDDQTKVAVSDFQRSRGLPSTGNLNSDTAAALGLDPNEVMPVRGSSDAAADRNRPPGQAPQGPATGDDVTTPRDRSTTETPQSDTPPVREPGY